MNLKLSKTAIRELTRLYKGVLVAAIIATAIASTGAKATDFTVNAGSFVVGTDPVTGTGSVTVTGLAKTDLDTTVQASLGKADTALQAGANISTLTNDSDFQTSTQVSSAISTATSGMLTTSNYATTLDSVYAKTGDLPTKTSDLTNDSDFQTSTQVSSAISTATSGMLTTSNYATTLDSVYAKTGDLPTKTSDLTNDSGYITNTVSDLTNYTKTTDLAAVATSGKGSDLSDWADKQDAITSTNKLSADLVDDASSTNKFVTAAEKTQITTNKDAIATLNGGESDAGSVKNTAKGYADAALASANTNIDNAIVYDSTSGLVTFKNSDGSTDTTAYSKDKADTTFAGLAANNTFTGTNTFNGGIISKGDISTTGDISAADGTFSGTLNVTGTSTLGAVNAGAISGTTGSFTGKVTSLGLDAGSGAITTTGTLTAGASTLDSLGVTNNATVGGILNVTGALSGSTASFTGDVSTTGALSGASISTTGALTAGSLAIGSTGYGITSAGAASVASLTSAGNITTTQKVGAGSLEVTGTSTLKGVATLEQGFKFSSSGTAITAADDGSTALTGGNATTLATTATVLKSAENATYTGTKVTGDSASTTLNGALNQTVLALNNVLTTAGTEVDSAKVDVQWNGTDSTLATVLGNGTYSSENQITKGDSMTVALGKLDAAVGNTTFSGKNAASAADLTAAVNAVDTAIGDRSTLSATNGNLTASSDIVTALNALDGTLGNIKALDGTDSTGPTGNLAASGKTVADHLNAIDTRLGQIDGLVANANDTTTSTGVNYHGNLAVGTTIEEHLEALDAAIGDRRNDYTNEYTITKGEAITESLDALDTVIGDIAGMANAGGNLGADVATSLDGLDAAIGDRNYTSTKYVTAGDDLTTAVSTLDQNIERVENKVDNLGNRVNKMHHEMKSGFASLAAMSALVPNARVAGDTQIAVGTGYYRGTTGFALGAFHHINDNVLLNAGASYAGNGSAVFKGGVTFGF